MRPSRIVSLTSRAPSGSCGANHAQRERLRHWALDAEAIDRARLHLVAAGRQPRQLLARPSATRRSLSLERLLPSTRNNESWR